MSSPVTDSIRNRVNSALTGSLVSSWTIQPSTRSGKKWMAVIHYPDHVEVVHFGAIGFTDYLSLRQTGKLSEADHRRKSFRSRFASLISSTSHDPSSPMFWANLVLW